MSYRLSKPFDYAQLFCPTCNAEATDAILLGAFPSSEEEAISAAKSMHDTTGHPIYYDYQEDKNQWELLILDHCAYSLVENARDKISIDHYNHPYHHIGRPYNIIKSNTNIIEAIELSKDLKLRDDQEIFIAYSERGWSVLTSLDTEQRAMITRLDEIMPSEVLYSLIDIYSFKEYVIQATDQM